MKTVYKLFTMLTLLAISGGLFAQGKITGEVQDAQTRLSLIGATVIVEGTTTGATTNVDGEFSFEAPAGTHNLIISYMGYQSTTASVVVEDGKTSNIGVVKLSPAAIGLAGISIIADRAKPRETPVAFSNIEAKQLKEQLGSRDIPLVMNTTPNVYSTMQGGGAGDARINVRGFDQRNVAIMINGVPVNDMENGWVYWSNWDGIGDATSSIQMQRGLSAINLATPSIGGTMNIITSPAEQKAGVMYKQEFGSGQFYKSTFMAHTGLVDGKWAVSAGGVRKTGAGVINKTWTDAWAYYLGASYNINAKNRLEFYAMGAPQRHGQNLYKQNIAAYDHEYAKDEFNYPDSALMKFPEAANGRLYNENWGPVSFRYNGKQSWNGKEHDRYNEQFINERENFYHKPLVNLNWYSQLSEKLYLFTTAYYSGGVGGGTGTYGDMKWNYGGPSRMVDFDATIANNTVSDTAHGILRNSRNNQSTYGVISKLRWDVSERFKVSVGLDARTAQIEHYREVRDLLGGKFFYYDGNDFDSPSGYNKVLGDKVAYDFTNDVNWVGGYLQGEYSTETFTAYATAGYSMIKYKYTNHFKKGDDGGEQTAETDNIGGYQAKGGFSYNLTESLSAFVNAGYVSKVPIFDAVINDRDGTVATDPENEKFTSFEGGLIFNTMDNRFWVSGNFYYTNWTDRTRSIGVQKEDGSEGFVFITGMAQKHSGFEIEGNWRPVDMVGLQFAGSINDWTYTDNVSGTYKDYDNPDTEVTENYYVKDLKVGDAPQTQLVVGLSLYPVEGMRLQLLSKYYADYFANWDPFSRTDKAEEGVQVWQVPNFNVFDLHFNYTLPFETTGATFEVFAHVFNLFDAIYIQDATDNSRYNGYYGYDNRYSHQAPAAEVFLGLPRTYNFGLLINVR